MIHTSGSDGLRCQLPMCRRSAAVVDRDLPDCEEQNGEARAKAVVDSEKTTVSTAPNFPIENDTLDYLVSQ